MEEEVVILKQILDEIIKISQVTLMTQEKVVLLVGAIKQNNMTSKNKFESSMKELIPFMVAFTSATVSFGKHVSELQRILGIPEC